MGARSKLISVDGSVSGLGSIIVEGVTLLSIRNVRRNMRGVKEQKVKKPTLKQIRKFWERWGFVNEITRTPPLNIFGGDIIYNWTHPDKVIHSKELPPIDPNSLFKYAVSKVNWYSISIVEDGTGRKLVLAAVQLKVGAHQRTAINKDLALALFWALW